MKILLVNPPTLKVTTTEHLGKAWQESTAEPARPYYDTLLAVDRKQIERGGYSTFTGEHLGLQSLQASLIGAGHQAALLNACLELHRSLPETLKRISEFDFEMVGFTGPLEVFSENRWLASALREQGFSGHITIGHDFPTLNHDTLLRLCPEFDSVVRGEGEETLVDLIDALIGGRPLATVPGLSFRRGKEVVTNAPRQAITNLDALPVVTRLDLPAVLQLRMSPAIYTKRGCLYQCAFCTTGQVPVALGFKGVDKWRTRSPKSVVDEIEHLVQDFGVRHVTIVDDLYVSKGAQGTAHALEVADLLLTRGLTIEYMIDCRVDSIDRSTFRRLKDSGLRKVFIGVESGSELVLKEYKKGYRHADFIKAQLAILEDLGIKFVMGFIFFNPIDDLDGLEASRRLVQSLDYREPFSFMKGVRVYPGTTLHRQLEARGLISGEWPDFTAHYANRWVDALRQRMSDFFQLASQLLETDTVSPDWEAVRVRDMTYELVGSSLGDMIEACRSEDPLGLDKAYRRMVSEFTELMGQRLAT